MYHITSQSATKYVKTLMSTLNLGHTFAKVHKDAS